MRSPSDRASTAMPSWVSSCWSVPIRLLSLTASSAASRMSVTPSANAAATASAGISSCTFGISSPPIVVPVRSAERTANSPTGSPHTSDVCRMSICAPMRHSTSTNPRRVGLRLTCSRTMSDPGVTVAATTKNADDDGSPGTSRSNGSGSPRRTRTVSPSTSIGAPSATSIRSV